MEHRRAWATTAGESERLAAVGFVEAPDGLEKTFAGLPIRRCTATVSMGPRRADSERSRSTVTIRTELGYPYFRWFLVPALWWSTRRISAGIEAVARGDADSVNASVPFAGDARLTHEEGVALSIFGFAVFVANFNGSLYGQLSQAMAQTYHSSDQQLGDALAWMRTGTFLALMLGLFADRSGRRRMLLAALVVGCSASVVAACAPSLAVMTVAGGIGRGALNAALPLAGILAVEAAGERTRAFAVAMVTLATGAGYGLGVAMLPFTDLAPWAWRAIFLLAASTALLLPRWYRRCPESERFLHAHAQAAPRGTLPARHVFGLAMIAMLTNVFAAPSSQLMNQFLKTERHFSGTGISAFRAITNGFPGMIGVLWGGRRAEHSGRESSIVLGTVVGSLATALLFAGPDWLAWPASTVAVICVGLAGTAFGAFSAELSPTRRRGALAGILAVVGVIGSVIGLVLAPRLGHVLGSLGRGLAVLSIVPVISLIALRFLPETARKTLDEITGDMTHETLPIGDPLIE
ncbi:MAG: MFS transporter [Acidimicrobiia bacterium]